jgi:dephospho-CoA kinase
MMIQSQVRVRRARPADAKKIAAFINSALRGRKEIDDMAVIERFGTVGFLLAERGETLVGMLGWQIENLVARVTDFLIGPAAEREPIGRALLNQMEREARVLECEAAILFLPRPAPPALVQFYRNLGYEPHIVSELPKAWQEAAQEGGLRANETVMLKKLREKRVLRPI